MSSNLVAQQLVAGRYELIEPVGRGGFGVVWRACDTLLQRHVAVKEVHLPGFLGDEDRAQLRDKVLREARAAARLDHPGAVTVFDVIDDDGRPVIVMELVEAPNLAELVAGGGPLPPAEVARIGLEVLGVLDVAHAHGIVHRDVKPANVMVAESGRVRLGDFGVAAILDDPTVSSSGSVTGSPAYMAPEQATNKGAVAESDLWSLGATMYFAVEGRPPFDKGGALPTLTAIVQDPPRPMARAGALGPVLDALLVKRPEDRLATAPLRAQLAEVAAGADAAAASEPGDTDVIQLGAPVAATVAALVEPPPTVAAPPPTPTRQPPRPRRAAPAGHTSRRRAPAVVGLVVVAALALVAVGLATRSSTTSSPSTGSPSTSAGAPTTAVAKPRTGGAPTPGATDTATYTDPATGFTIARPGTWAPRTDGTLTDFRDPDTGAYLRVDHIQPPGPSPQGAWIELEKSFSAENANYHRIRIEPTAYNGFDAAIWEFTYSSGGADLHVVDLGMVTGRYGFALYFQTKAADWARLQAVFETFKATFKAPK